MQESNIYCKFLELTVILTRRINATNDPKQKPSVSKVNMTWEVTKPSSLSSTTIYYLTKRFNSPLTATITKALLTPIKAYPLKTEILSIPTPVIPTPAMLIKIPTRIIPLLSILVPKLYAMGTHNVKHKIITPTE